MKRKTYASSLSSASGPYSAAVDGGELIFISGQTARNSMGEGKNAQSIKDQTREAFRLLFDILEDAGLDQGHVLKVNVFLTSMKHFEEMNEVYEEHFQAPYPARTTVAVLELPLGADVEIELVAKR